MGLGEAACFQQQPWGAGGALQVFVGPVGLIIDFQRQVAAPVSVSTVVRYCIIKRKGEQPWWGAGKGKARCKQLQHFYLKHWAPGAEVRYSALGPNGGGQAGGRLGAGLEKRKQSCSRQARVALKDCRPTCPKAGSVLEKKEVCLLLSSGGRLESCICCKMGR